MDIICKIIAFQNAEESNATDGNSFEFAENNILRKKKVFLLLVCILIIQILVENWADSPCPDSSDCFAFSPRAVLG